MLSILRKSVGTWVAKVFILLLVASFGVWGVSGSIVGNNAGTVIQVGDTEVSANDYVLAYERARYGLAQQFGRLLSQDEAKIFGIESNVLSQLVSGAVLDETASKMKLGLSDKNLAALIGEDTAFQDASGRFDRRTLTQQLRQLGMSEADYVKNRQSVAVRNQLLEGTSANTQASQVYLAALEKYRAEKRVFEYLTVGEEMLEQPPSPTDDKIRAYYEKNKSRYMAPEYRKLIIVKLEPEDVSDPGSITDDEIEEEYEARKSEFRTDEKRAIQQLTLTDEEQGKTVLKRLEAGELFETIIADLGKSESDINIGEYTQKGLPDANIAKAVFALELNEVSDVVAGIFGPVILRVTKITPESVKPLADVKEDLRARLALVKAGEVLFDIHDSLEDERASGDVLVDAAKKVNLKIRTIDKIDATGRLEDGTQVNDLPESSKLLRQAFESAVNVETDPISIGSSGFVWYEVAEVFPKRQKTLDEVRQELTKAWVEEETSRLVFEKAEEIVKAANDGDDIASAFRKAFPNSAIEPKIEKSAELTRTDSSEALPEEAVKAGFLVAKGVVVNASGKKNSDRIILKVVDVNNTTSSPIGPDEVKQLDESIGGDILNQMVVDMQARTGVSINQGAIIAAQNLIR